MSWQLCYWSVLNLSSPKLRNWEDWWRKDSLFLLFSLSLSHVNSLRSHGLQHAKLPWPSPSPGVCSNSCPLRSCHPTISSSVTPFSSYLQYFPAPGSFPMSWLFASGGQSIGASASASVLPMNILGWFPFKTDWFDLLAVQGILKSLLQHNSKASVLQCPAFFMVQLSHLYMTTGKTTALAIWTFVSKVMSLLFNTLSRFVRAFLPRSNHLLISWLQPPLSVQPCFFQFTMPELWIQPTADSAVLFSAIKLMIGGPLGQQGLAFLSMHYESEPVLSPLIHSATRAVVGLCPPFHRWGNWGSQFSILTKPRSPC